MRGSSPTVVIPKREGDDRQLARIYCGVALPGNSAQTITGGAAATGTASLHDSRLRQDGNEEAYLGNEIFGGSLCLGIAHRTTTATAAAIAIAAAAIATGTGRGAQPPGSTPSRRG